jgi:HPr kinase/phosphorylase
VKSKQSIVNIHASCVRVGRAGVLLLGKSGSGKSDLALRLIAESACLVADDRTELFVKNGKLFARAPENLTGLIEIRGLGIVEFASVPQTAIMLAVRLGGEGRRLPDPERYAPPKPLEPAVFPPLIALNGFAASAPARIHAALAAFSRHLFRHVVNPK